METKTKEFLWSTKLNEEKKVANWNGRQDGALEQIILKLAVLGAGAVKEQRNLVQVTSFDSDEVKTNTCICSLTVGVKENQQLADLSLFPPVKFTLLEGSGPVHLVANHIMFDEDDLSDDDVSDSETETTEDLREKLKRKEKGKGDAQAKSASQVKQIKTATEEVDSDEDDDDFEDMEDDDEEEDDDDEDQEEVSKNKNQKPSKQQKGVTSPQKKRKVEEKAREEESDDNEEDVDGDDEAEEEVAPPKKRKLTNGKSAETNKLTSPDRNGKKPEQKTPKSQKDPGPKTPKSEKKTPGKVQYTSVEQVKAAIQKYPGGKPRKEDKFGNWVKNTFRVSEASWISDLWKWHKKEIGL